MNFGETCRSEYMRIIFPYRPRMGVQSLLSETSSVPCGPAQRYSNSTAYLTERLRQSFEQKAKSLEPFGTLPRHSQDAHQGSERSNSNSNSNNNSNNNNNNNNNNSSSSSSSSSSSNSNSNSNSNNLRSPDA